MWVAVGREAFIMLSDLCQTTTSYRTDHHDDGTPQNVSLWKKIQIQFQ